MSMIPARQRTDKLKSNDDGGTYDPMEARIKRLEDGFAEIGKDLKAMRSDLSEVKGRVNSMPTSWQLLGMILAIMGASFAIIRFGLAGL